MPEIKLQHIVSVSSEDKNHPAENLLKTEGYRKWKSASNGEKQVSVTLQFEKASQIHQIDIGNEGSAFVEVLVGKSTAKDDDYQVILVASSFMSPMESRNNTNINRVRMFGSDKLSNAVLEQKWDRVKVVCTQPFNKSSAYGISFIKLHSKPDSTENGSQKATPAPKKQITLGKFTVKADEEEEDVKMGSLFANRGKEKTEPTPLTGAAAVRAASKLATESQAAKPPPETGRKSPGAAAPKRRRDSNEEDKPATTTTNSSNSKTPLRKQSTSISTVSSTASAKKEGPPPLKKTKSEPGKRSDAKELRRLMEDVVFVMSGFQNPYRAELRDKAVEMGAKYKPDWGRNCTHLICAFANTPKYNQVKGDGRIVTKSWILDSYKQKKLMPWRKYRLGDAPSPSESSEDEDEVPAPRKHKPSPKRQSPKAAAKTGGTTSPKGQGADGDDCGGSTDVDDSGNDTEDEIRKLKQSEAKKSKEEDLYGGSTDEDSEDDSTDGALPELPDFFADKHFFLYGQFSAAERRSLNRYITAFDGTVDDYMGDKVSFVITTSDWDENFDEALAENPSISFVRPQWIYACNDKSKLVPHQKYIAVPK